VARYKAVAPALRPQDLKDLPALSQEKWGEQIFRPAFKGDAGVDFSNCVDLGEICFISGGLEMQSHERFDPIVDDERQKLFVKDDLLSPHRSKEHKKLYIEAGDMDRYSLCNTRWLEWGTSRVPAKLRRSRFPELFENEKVMVARISAEHLTAFYDKDQEIVTNHTIIQCVPYHLLLEAQDTVARLMARQLSEEEVERYATGVERTKTEIALRVIEARAETSRNYDLGFVTSLLNAKWLSRHVLMTKRRGRLDFYPNDLREYPIAQADAETQSRIARRVEEIMDAKADMQRWRDEGHRIDETDIVLNPHPFLETWGVDHGDLIDAAGFLSYEIGGSITTIEREGQRLNFRQRPPSYVKSPHDHVLDYLTRYLETNREALDAVDATKMAQEIHIPRSPEKVKKFLDRLEQERERVMLRWMAAAQYENWIDERAFDLYDVEGDRREELGGTRYTLEGVPDDVDFVSILDDAEDAPMRRVAFQLEGEWYYRTEEALPNAVLIWMHDGEQTMKKHGIVGDRSIVLAG
jgi:hypothetical protein